MTKPILLFGLFRGAADWCLARSLDLRDPSILLGTVGSEAIRYLERHEPEDLTIILVPGWGHRGAERDKAREIIMDYRKRGADVRLWVG